MVSTKGTTLDELTAMQGGFTAISNQDFADRILVFIRDRTSCKLAAITASEAAKDWLFGSGLPHIK
ncbi:MAG: hypothetical protein ACJAYC_001792 [Halieaceae bacterium]|jgi:hypothetical protein